MEEKIPLAHTHTLSVISFIEAVTLNFFSHSPTHTHTRIDAPITQMRICTYQQSLKSINNQPLKYKIQNHFRFPSFSFCKIQQEKNLSPINQKK